MDRPLSDRPLTIALDAMSGDQGPGTVVQAAYAVVNATPDVHLTLVGLEAPLHTHLKALCATSHPRLTIHAASQIVGMDELPSQALRFKKDSSMRVAIDLVKRGEADACVSAGNTGALMATARFVLKTLPGIDRPAICAPIPSLRGHTHMLDLGANVDSKADHLLQFAIMGSVLVSAVDNIAAPRVALLNIGHEEIKGNEQVKTASQLLANSPLNYIGFIEADQIFRADVDVVVCDGFVGNVALKSSEGVARLIRHYLQEEFRRTFWTRWMGRIAAPVLRALSRKIDPRRYNGASLLGLKGIVVKSHGSADAVAFAQAIHTAILEVKKAVLHHIDRHLAQPDRQSL